MSTVLAVSTSVVAVGRLYWQAWRDRNRAALTGMTLGLGASVPACGLLYMVLTGRWT